MPIYLTVFGHGAEWCRENLEYVTRLEKLRRRDRMRTMLWEFGISTAPIAAARANSSCSVVWLAELPRFMHHYGRRLGVKARSSCRVYLHTPLETRTPLPALEPLPSCG
jgi:hypothetical protein